jgi:hypothetical protein
MSLFCRYRWFLLPSWRFCLRRFFRNFRSLSTSHNRFFEYLKYFPPLFATINPIDPSLLRLMHRKLLAWVAVSPSASAAAAVVELVMYRPAVFPDHPNVFL